MPERAMRRWELAVALDPARAQPLFVQLASAITHDIRAGRLKSGEALPGSRELARQLGVNRNTVMAAYRELIAEGQVSTRIGGGTFVADAAPRWPRRLPARTHTDQPTYPLAAQSLAGPPISP